MSGEVWQVRRDEYEQERRQQRAAVIAQFTVGNTEATMHAYGR
jgi:hypothetical protein